MPATRSETKFCPVSDSTGNVLWEQRWHPFRAEWVLYTSHRGGRPWIGETTQPQSEESPSYDPTCALCPGNERIKGRNPQYTGSFWFTNDLPVFGAGESVSGEDPFYRTRPATGTAEVICYHPDHGKTFALLSETAASEVVALWRERTAVLSGRADISHVLIFENKGSAVGTSNPHPHCQLYAGNMVYRTMQTEADVGRQYLAETGRTIGQDVLQREAASSRVISENEFFVASVPWFARYAYEVVVLPRRPMTSLVELRDEEVSALGAVLREVTIRYDNLWRMPMPYVMAIHQAPCDGSDAAGFPFHFEFHPPLRKPDTLKYLAGPEVGGGSMTNESNPDEKAAELQAVSTTHYLDEPTESPNEV